MKISLNLIRTAIAILPILLISQPLQAQETQPRFMCGKDEQGNPATIVKLPDGTESVVVHYVSGAFAGAGYSNQKRCDEISARFQYFNEKREFDYMTIGKINGQNVVCVTRQEGGDCSRDLKWEGLLMTVRPGISPRQTLSELLNVRVSAGGSLRETGDDDAKPFVNVKCLIDASRSAETQSAYNACANGSPKLSGSTSSNVSPTKPPSKKPLW